MKMNFHKIVALLLVAIIGITLLSACGNEKTVNLADIYSLNMTEKEIESGKTFGLLVLDSSNGKRPFTTEWDSDNEDVATILNRMVTANNAGTATITVTLTVTVNGEDKVLKLPCVVTVTKTDIDVESISFLLKTVTAKIGKPTHLDINIIPFDATNQNLIWSSSDMTIATVIDGNVTGLLPGVTTIKASTADGKFYDECEVTIAEPVDRVDKIALDKKTLTVTEGETGVLAVTTTAKKIDDIEQDINDIAVTWESSDTSIATVNSDGTVFGIKSGKVKITVTANDEITPKTATCDVTVKAVSSSSSNSSGSSSSGSDSNSNNSSSGSNSSGSNSSGSSSSGSSSSGSSSTVRATSAAFDKNSLTLYVGDTTTYKLNVTVLPSNTTQQGTWSSDAPSVASVDQDGNITVGTIGSKAFDTAMITYTVGSVKANAVVVVKRTDSSGSVTPPTTTNPPETIEPPIYEFDVDLYDITLEKSLMNVVWSGAANPDSNKINVIFTPSDASDKEIVWSSSDNDKCYINSATGEFKCYQPGRYTITATNPKTGLSASCTIVCAGESRTYRFSEDSLQIYKYGYEYTTAFIQLSLDTNLTAAELSSATIKWISSNTSIMVVESLNSDKTKAVVKGRGLGVATITAEITLNGTTFTPAPGYGTTLVSVTDGQSVTNRTTSISLNKTSLNLNIGQSERLTHTFSLGSNDIALWSSSNTDVAVVSNNGTITATGDGSATIYCKSAGGYPNDATCHVTVGNSSSVSDIIDLAINETYNIPLIGGMTAILTSGSAAVDFNTTSGAIRGKAVGTAVIAVSYNGSLFRTYYINVTAQTATDTASASMAVDTQIAAYTLVSSKLASVTSVSSTSDLVTINGLGIATKSTPGTATITIVGPNRETPAKITTITLTLTITAAPTYTLTHTSISSSVSGSQTLTYTLSPSTTITGAIATSSNNDYSISATSSGNIITVIITKKATVTTPTSLSVPITLTVAHNGTTIINSSYTATMLP